MVPYYGALAEGAFDAARRPRLQLDRERIDAAAAAHALAPSSYWTFAPGAEYGPAKRWPAEHYAALARALHARDGAPIVLLGSPAEATLCEEIAAQSGGACRVVAGGATLLESIALIAGSRGLASNDSGLMHVAAAFGVAQVAVFGSTSPLHTPPLSDRARVLWLKDELGLDCMPCFERTCRFGHYRCLTAVTPDRALAVLDSATGPPTAAAPPSRREGSEAGREQS
jgi:heptosyltransferase-2